MGSEFNPSAEVSEVEALMRELDTLWGFGQVACLVPVDLAAKFQRQIEKWQTAVAANDVGQIQVHGQAMRKAAAAVDAAARAAGHRPLAEAAVDAVQAQPDELEWVSVCRLKSGDAIFITRDGIEADLLSRQGNIAFTFAEIALCAEASPGWATLMETKRLFGMRGNATVVRPAADRKFFEEGGDDIPF